MNAQVAREYRIKYPQMPSLTLARVMYNENAEVFKDVESARSALRYIEGKKGAESKKDLKDKSLVLENERPKNPFKIPDSEETSYEPYIIKGVTKLLILSDVHIPYHNVEALNLALQYGKDTGCDGILLNGDFLDFFQLSRFDKDPRKRSFAYELEIAKQVLEILAKNFGCKIFYKIGNHEERYEKYMMAKCRELLGVDDFELKNILKLKDYNCEVISDQRIIKANSLNLIHGHEYRGMFSPVNIARGLYMRGKVSAIQGHNHQTSEHTESNMNGDIVTTWSVGCLSELHPAYMPLNKWNHGFAVVELASNKKDFHVDNKRIFKGKVY